MKEIEKMEDEEIIEKLTQVKGVGRWTVEMFLMFNLGRHDVWPVGDFGVRRGYQIAFKKRAMPEAKKLIKLGKNWTPYRSWAARYLWKVADAAKLNK